MEEQSQIRGINLEAVARWFESHVEGAKAPLEFTLIAGGHSNLTFKVIDAGGEEKRPSQAAIPFSRTASTAATA